VCRLRTHRDRFLSGDRRVAVLSPFRWKIPPSKGVSLVRGRRMSLVRGRRMSLVRGRRSCDRAVVKRVFLGARFHETVQER